MEKEKAASPDACRMAAFLMDSAVGSKGSKPARDPLLITRSRLQSDLFSAGYQTVLLLLPG
jgi:hypothetical protein